MTLWIVQYYHKYGTDVWPVFAKKCPKEADIIKDIPDFKGEEENEWIEIVGPFDVPEKS